MSAGIRATVTVAADGSCPIGRFSRTTGTVIDQVSTSVGRSEQASVTEFLAPTDEPGTDGVDGPLFSYGTEALYRTNHEIDVSNSSATDSCPCECLGTFGCPIHRYSADDGEVTLVFHAADFEQLQAVMADFRERFPSVDVKQLLQPPLEGTPEDRVFVNRGKLTDRQAEVLEMAFEMGYFKRPKGANATEIAAELDIAQSTFTEHLMAAQRKIFEDVLE